jgi:hypothetical protein
MFMTNNELGAKVAEIYGQEFEEGEVEGPNLFGPYVARRVWTSDGKEYHAHYAIERGDKLQTFEDFAPFAVWLAGEFSLDDRMGRTERMIGMAVATCVVLVGLGLLVFLVGWDRDRAAYINYLLSAVVGGAAMYLFKSRARPRTI